MISFWKRRLFSTLPKGLPLAKHAVISVFDLFSIGIGPSSSHTVGPMRAARQFAKQLEESGRIAEVTRIRTDLYGSLALTGEGHGTPKAILLGLEGNEPHSVCTESIDGVIEAVKQSSSLRLLSRHRLAFRWEEDLRFNYDQVLPGHSNGMRFMAFNASGDLLNTRIYYSTGGGFIREEGVCEEPEEREPRFEFATASQLLQHCRERGLSIAELCLQNELMWRDRETIERQTMQIWQVMDQSIQRGCTTTQTHLPGPLRLKRRAPSLHAKLKASTLGPMAPLEYLSLYAMAVNEENAGGGRVVTAPTNGAAGVIPAVLKYGLTFHPIPQEWAIRVFLHTAACIGMLYKHSASISAAEVGCQGEVGVACSMAAAGLTAILGGTINQVEQAAEIGMEHCLGLTCDPVGGLVQIPCIERNAMGAAKAVTASQLALREDGEHRVSLDQVIETMRQTGADMGTKYRETSLGGLAVNVPLC